MRNMGVSRKYFGFFTIPIGLAKGISFILCFRQGEAVWVWWDALICFNSSARAGGNICRGLQMVSQDRQKDAKCWERALSLWQVGGGICAIQTAKIAHDALLTAFYSLAESSSYLFISTMGAAVLGIFFVGLSSCLGWWLLRGEDAGGICLSSRTADWAPRASDGGETWKRGKIFWYKHSTPS